MVLLFLFTGSNIAWVQHAKTGELVPVVIMGGEETNETDREENMDSKNTDQAKVPLLRPSPLITTYQDIEGGQALAVQFDGATHSFDDTVVLIRSAFLFAQGLLAGFCFTTICNETSAAHGDVEFVVSYQPNAMQYRRLFYLLSTISVVGSIDTFMSITLKVSRDIEKRKKKQENTAMGIGGKPTELPMNSGGIFMSFCRALGSAQEGTNVAVALILMVLHAIAFLCTIIMSQVDVIIAVRGGMSPMTPDTVWANALMSSSEFPDLLRSWKNLDQVRLVASALAWLLCCFLSWRNLSAVEAKNTEIHQLKDAMHEWKQRVDLLEGNEGLEDLSISALKHLVSLQQMGLERSKISLKSLTEASRA